MLQGLVNSARRWLDRLGRALFGAHPHAPKLPPASPGKVYRRLERVRLTDQVCRTLFEDYANHRGSRRGEEEIGWVLLGVREENEVVVRATLPAGANRSAGVAHVRFNSSGQALGSRIVRQWDRGLALVGVVHTHPGSLRQPSDGDYQGDSPWVAQLRGGDGVFGIGTADVGAMTQAERQETHREVLGDLSFSWYALAKGEPRYRKLPIEIVLGPDLARPLHPVWDLIEAHAEALDCLYRQQAGVTFEVPPATERASLVARVPLADPGDFLRVILERSEVRYIVQRQGLVSAVDPEEDRVDRAVSMILAELAGLQVLEKQGPVKT